jgi:hypothetical protein
MTQAMKFSEQPDNHNFFASPTEIDPPEQVAAPFGSSPFVVDERAEAQLASQQRGCIRLDLEDLDCFEVVDRQFERWGVRFANAVALQPSNPAFPSRSGKTVLMGAPRSGRLEATFNGPVTYVSGFITSSRRTVLSAYDEKDRPLASTASESGNLAGSSSRIPPNVQLSLQAANIRRIIFHTFDGELTLDEFSFSYG